MSRFRANYDMDYLEQGRWDRNLRATIRGKNGQRLLRQLREALKALPEPRLIEGQFTSPEGECCTLGALCAYQKAQAEGTTIREAAQALSEKYRDDDGLDAGEKAGLSWTLAWFLGYQNDDRDELGRLTPEDRYREVMKWLDKVIREPEAGA